MESQGWLFSSWWGVQWSIGMAFNRVQWCCGISWSRTPNWRWSWIVSLCVMWCQLWDWVIARMYGSTHRWFRVMWLTSIFAPTPIVEVLVVVRCRLGNTHVSWFRVYWVMMIGGFAPRWCMTRLTSWPIPQRSLVWRWKPKKRGYRQKTIRRRQPYSQSCGRNASIAIQRTPGTPGSPVIPAVRAMAVVWRVGSIATVILRNASDAIR